MRESICDDRRQFVDDASLDSYRMLGILCIDTAAGVSSI
jgi:hypothetical protein